MSAKFFVTFVRHCFVRLGILCIKFCEFIYSIIQKAFWKPLFTAGIYLFRVSNGNIRTLCEIWSRWRHFGVFIVNFEHIKNIVLVFPLLSFKTIFFVKFIYLHIVIKLVTMGALVSSQSKLTYFLTPETIKLSLERKLAGWFPYMGTRIEENVVCIRRKIEFY